MWIKTVALQAKMECAICYEVMSRDVIKTECGHQYHAACIGTWFQTHSTCPTCRTVVAPMADAAEPQYEGPLVPSRRFSCRTLAPWEEVRWGFLNAAGFRLWLNEVMGGVTWQDVQGVRTWCQGAQAGDVLYLNDELAPVERALADFEVICNV